MQKVEPVVHVIARTYPDDDAIATYLDGIDARDFATNRHFDQPEDLIEFAGRLCYKSFEPGLNLNVTKVRTDQADYIRNILSSLHGSVTEHVTWTLLFENVSRVLTHELVRHRVGVAVSQESGRYVRLAEIPMWFPSWALEDPYLMGKAVTLLEQMEAFQDDMTKHFDLDESRQKFSYKKARTSFLRRFHPAGAATNLVWTANVRTLRHVIESRTAVGAEEEIRLVFSEVARAMRRESPLLFGDFKEQDDASWKPEWSKV